MRDITLQEGTAAHFEAKIIPIGDPKLKVDWLKNGKPIQASNRLSYLHDFGFVALDLKYTRMDDSGTYTCRAINELGEANITANLKGDEKKITHLIIITHYSFTHFYLSYSNQCQRRRSKRNSSW